MEAERAAGIDTREQREAVHREIGARTMDRSKTPEDHVAEPLTPARALASLEQLSVTRAQVLDNGIVLLTFGPDPHRLEILDCAWRVQTSDAVVVGSTDGAGVRQEQVRRLAGAQVTATSVTGPFFDATVRFATVELRMFPFVVGAGDPYWRVRTPTDDTVACL